MKGTRFNHKFLKKNWGQGQLGHIGPKMVDPHNSGSVKKISFFQFCIMKGTKKCIKIIIMVFSEKIMFGANPAFWTQEWHILIIVDPLRGFFLNFAK